MARKKKKKVSKTDLRKEIESLRKEMEERTSTEQYDKLSNNIEDLNEQITKMVSININLQSKMTELLIKVTDLIRENRELIGLLEEASEAEVMEPETSRTELLNELKMIKSSISEMSSSFKGLEKYIKKAYTKEMLSKAVGGKVEAPPEKKEEEGGGAETGGTPAAPESMPKEVGGGKVGSL